MPPRPRTRDWSNIRERRIYVRPYLITKVATKREQFQRGKFLMKSQRLTSLFSRPRFTAARKARKRESDGRRRFLSKTYLFVNSKNGSGDYKLRGRNERRREIRRLCKDETTVIYDPGNLSKLPRGTRVLRCAIFHTHHGIMVMWQ